MADAKLKPAAPRGVWTTIKPFVNGGASGMLATCVIQPIDMVKVRIQLGQGSASHVASTMFRNEGIGAFYKGLSAGLLRQATYTTARLGSFRYGGGKLGLGCGFDGSVREPQQLYHRS